VPCLIIEYDALLILNIYMIIYLFDRLIRNLFIQLTAVLIVFVDIFALLPGCCHIIGQHQIHSLLTVHHSARCIDARAYFEDNIVYVDLFAVQTAYLNNPPQSKTGIRIELFQPMVS